MGWLIEIDRDACIGSGNCAFYAPATFDIDDASKAVLLAGAGDAGADPLDVVLQSAEGCPVRAIRVARDGVTLFPVAAG